MSRLLSTSQPRSDSTSNRDINVDLVAMETTDDEGVHMVRPQPSDSLSYAKGPATDSDYTKLMWACFCAMGAINNFSYCVVGAAAVSLASSFNQSNLIGVITWANVGFGIGTKAFNAAFLLNSEYNWRIHLTGFLMALGLLIVAVSVFASFWLSIFGILVIGSFSAFGESVILAYLKHFHVNMTGAFSSGTGVAGIAGVGLYLILATLGMSNMAIFLTLLPTSLIYCFAFIYVDRVYYKPKILGTRSRTLTVVNPNPLMLSSDQTQLDPLVSRGREESVDSGMLINVTKKEDVIRVLRIVWVKAALLLIVYFYEYVCMSGFAAVSTAHTNAYYVKNKLTSKESWVDAQAYPLLVFAYQFGVFISRSSIQIVQIRRIWILAFLQAVNFAIWWWQAADAWIPIPLQVIHMVYVGLLGGAMYINVFYLINTETVEEGGVEHKDKELAVNIIAIGNIIGITLASIWEVVMMNSWMKIDDTASHCYVTHEGGKNVTTCY